MDCCIHVFIKCSLKLFTVSNKNHADLRIKVMEIWPTARYLENVCLDVEVAPANLESKTYIVPHI